MVASVPRFRKFLNAEFSVVPTYLKFAILSEEFLPKFMF